MSDAAIIILVCLAVAILLWQCTVSMHRSMRIRKDYKERSWWE
jgi:hypothetical protein